MGSVPVTFQSHKRFLSHKGVMSVDMNLPSFFSQQLSVLGQGFLTKNTDYFKNKTKSWKLKLWLQYLTSSWACASVLGAALFLI